jgi:3-deoxy-manno-octulosonate cytidylyltransferase (CMP-KDO synthetase)
MHNIPACHGIIPARYGSTRFPGKALADIEGKPMFWHVWSRAAQCPDLCSVTLATDDLRIARAAGALGVPVLMTSAAHQSGTDRVFEAASILNLPDDSVIVNIQGDEPALQPHLLGELVRPFFAADGAKVRVSTLARPISAAEAALPDRVKVVRDAAGNALYFSRSPIPYSRDGKAAFDYLVHIGLYAFRYEALRLFTLLGASFLERTEKLEQLRLLENGIPIRVELTAGRSLGVDSPEDLAEVKRVLQEERRVSIHNRLHPPTDSIPADRNRAD